MIQKTFIALLSFVITALAMGATEQKASMTARYSPGKISAESFIEVTVVIEENWHITSNQPKDEYLIPAEIHAESKHITFESTLYPPPVEKYIPELDMVSSLFDGIFIVTLPVKSVDKSFSSADSLATLIEFTYQPCDDKMCLPPITTSLVIGGEEYRPQKDAKKSAAASVVQGQSAAFNLFDLFIKLLFAVIGGLILNLMPCVLPVLSLKVFSLIKQAGESRRKLIQLGLTFSLGIFSSFWILALSVIVLRSAGSLVGWGFQFQNPFFIIAMAAVMVVFAMNMFGVFEIFLPNAAHTKLNLMSSKSSYAGAFFNGVLMTLLSTPCSAPFLGSAMGYAFSQTTLVLFVMFSGVAFGLSLPYMLLSFFPSAVAWVPKPGNWMVRLKEFMGFLLMATVVWLVSVLASARGIELASWTSFFLLTLAMAAWLYSHLLPNGGLGVSGKKRALVWACMITVSLGSFMLLVKPYINSTKTSFLDARHDEVFAYSEKGLNELLKSGRPVFIDFTASWCITCKTTEKLVLETPEVQSAFKNKNVAVMIADWTNGDEEITKKLASFNRVGVPLYVLYVPKRSQEAIVFPEIITKQTLLDTLEKLDDARD